MPAGVLPEARRRTIPITDQGAKGGRELGVPFGGPIVAPRRQIFLPDEDTVFSLSEKGWTNQKLAVDYLNLLFQPHTKKRYNIQSFNNNKFNKF